MKKKLLVVAVLAVVIISVSALTACNEEQYPVNFLSGEGYSFNLSSLMAYPGNDVTFRCEPKPGYMVDVVSVNGSPVSPNLDGSYTFVMPDQSVTVTATASAIFIVPDDDADDEKPVPTTEKLSDGFMAFDGICPDKISAFKNTYSAEIS